MTGKFKKKIQKILANVHTVSDNFPTVQFFKTYLYKPAQLIKGNKSLLHSFLKNLIFLKFGNDNAIDIFLVSFLLNLKKF